MRKKLPAFPFPPSQPGSKRLTRSQIEEQKKRAVRGFEALQAELEALRKSMSADEWERFNRPL